ncbi:MAG: transglycosylase SLT domain-containing protein [Bacteroidia bacterium]
MKLKLILLLLTLSFLPSFSKASTTLFDDYDSIAKRIVKIKTNIPIEYNQYVQQNINEFLRNDYSKTNALLGKGLFLLPEIEKILKKNRLPGELRYIAVALSGLDSKKVSEEGGSGIWQLKYHVAKTYGLKINSYIDERRDPLKSTEAASKYFEDLYKIYEDWNLTIAAFYSSPLDVNKAIRQSGGNLEYWKIHNYLPEEFQKTVPRFIASLYLFSHFRDHKLSAQSFKPVPTDTVAIKNWTTFEQIEKVMAISGDFLKEYNPIFKKFIIPYTPKKYFINIPSDKVKVFKDLEDSLYVFKDKEPGLVTIPDNRQKPNPIADSSSTDSSQAGSVNDEETEPKPKPKPTVENTKGLALLTYTVKRGDGLGRIADKYDCTITEIKKWNKMKSNMIKPGQKLKIYVPKSKLSKYKKVR